MRAMAANPEPVSAAAAEPLLAIRPVDIIPLVGKRSPRPQSEVHSVD